ncbi:hypothetical protein D3C73_926940 [compost metagenome]
MSVWVRIIATSPTGRLIRNSQCQLANCSSQPLKVGPIAGATIADNDHRLTANGLRSCGIT